MKILSLLLIAVVITGCSTTTDGRVSFNEDGTVTSWEERKVTGILDSRTYVSKSNRPDLELDPSDRAQRNSDALFYGPSETQRLVGPGPAVPAAVVLHGLAGGIGAANGKGAKSFSSATSGANTNITVP